MNGPCTQHPQDKGSLPICSHRSWNMWTTSHTSGTPPHQKQTSIMKFTVNFKVSAERLVNWVKGYLKIKSSDLARNRVNNAAVVCPSTFIRNQPYPLPASQAFWKIPHILSPKSSTFTGGISKMISVLAQASSAGPSYTQSFPMDRPSLFRPSHPSSLTPGSQTRHALPSTVTAEDHQVDRRFKDVLNVSL